MNKAQLKRAVSEIGRPVQRAITELLEMWPGLTAATKSGKSERVKPRGYIHGAAGMAHKCLRLHGEDSPWGPWEYGGRPEDHVAPIRERAGYIMEAARILTDMVAKLRADYADDAGGCRIADIDRLQGIVDEAARAVSDSPERINEACDAYVATFEEVEADVVARKTERAREDVRRGVRIARASKPQSSRLPALLIIAAFLALMAYVSR